MNKLRVEDLEKRIPDVELKQFISKHSQEGKVAIGVYKKFTRCAVKYVFIEEVTKTIEKEIGVKQKEGGVFSEIKNLLGREITLLSSLNHPHLVRIISHGFVEATLADEERLYYIMMEFVDGLPFTTAIINEKLTPLQVLRALRQVFEAIVFLHSNGITHLDLKPDNIMLQVRRYQNNEVDLNATIIDLGSAIVVDVSKLEEYLKSRESNGIFQTLTREIMEHYGRPNQRVLVRYDAGYGGLKTKRNESRKMPVTKFSSRSKVLNELFPARDLSCLSSILRDVVDLFQKRKFTAEKGIGMDAGSLDSSRVTSGLEIIAERLGDTASNQNGYYMRRAGHDKFAVMLEALRDLEKLDPAYLAATDVPELSSEMPNSSSIMLSERMIWFPESIRKIILHPFFQRLFYIPQLEFEYVVFPDARYSRGTHSLLTFQYTRRSLLALLSDTAFRLSLTKDLVIGTILYGLLHDIGHYPLSHMFEDFEGEYDVRSDDGMFPVLIESSNTKFQLDIGSLLEKKKGLRDTIEDVFGSGVIKVLETISACVNNDVETFNGLTETEEDRFLFRVVSGVLSSATDVDKLAYLIEDSKMTGAKYGMGVDPEIFFSSLIFPEPRKYGHYMEGADFDGKGSKKTLPVLFLRDFGMNAAESIILTRYWMLSRVYWNRANRAIMSAFKFIIKFLLGHEENYFRKYLSDCFFYSETQALKYISDDFDRMQMKMCGNGECGFFNPLRELNAHRGRDSIYRRIITFSAYGGMHGKAERSLDVRTYKLLTQVAEKGCEVDFTMRITDKISDFISKEFGTVEEFCRMHYVPEQLIYVHPKLGTRLRYGAILLDLPRKRRDLLSIDNIILLPEEQESSSPLRLGEKSTILGNKGKSIEKEFLEETKKYRIFAHPKLATQLEREPHRMKLKKLVSQSIKEYVFEMAGKTCSGIVRMGTTVEISGEG